MIVNQSVKNLLYFMFVICAHWKPNCPSDCVLVGCDTMYVDTNILEEHAASVFRVEGIEWLHYLDMAGSQEMNLP
jgi:hypothetical protein